MKIIENILYSTLPRNYLERGHRDRVPGQGPAPQGPHTELFSFSASSHPPPSPASRVLRAQPEPAGLWLAAQIFPSSKTQPGNVCVCVFLNPFGLIPGNYLLLCPWPHLRVTLALFQPFGKHPGHRELPLPQLHVVSELCFAGHTHTHNIIYIKNI